MDTIKNLIPPDQRGAFIPYDSFNKKTGIGKVMAAAETNNTVPSNKWAKPAGKAFSAPKWARFRLFVQYYQGNAKYHSFDYTYKFQHGIKTKIKSELTALTKLIELMHKKTKGQTYRYANIFVNLTSDLCTTKGNFDYLICTIVSGKLQWKNPIYWKLPDNNMLDVAEMRKYAAMLADADHKEKARQAVQTTLENYFNKK